MATEITHFGSPRFLLALPLYYMMSVTYYACVPATQWPVSQLNLDANRKVRGRETPGKLTLSKLSLGVAISYTTTWAVNRFLHS
jgi:hypothetical protein